MPTDILFQYQIKTQPVLTASQTAEQVTESRWHQPWSEPVRQKISPVLAIALITASGLFAPVLAPSQIGEQVTESRWHQPWSDPSVLAKPGLAAARQQFFITDPRALTQPETVTESRWHQAWSEPVRLRPRLPEPEQRFFEFQPMPSPFVASGWFNWLSEPVRLRPDLGASRQAFFFPSANPAVSFGWFSRLSEPSVYPDGRPSRLRAYLQQTLALVSLLQPETVIESKFHFAWSEPVRPRPGFAAWRQPFLHANAPYVVKVSLAVTETADSANLLEAQTGYNRAYVSIIEIAV